MSPGLEFCPLRAVSSSPAALLSGWYMHMLVPMYCAVFLSNNFHIYFHNFIIILCSSFVSSISLHLFFHFLSCLYNLESYQ